MVCVEGMRKSVVFFRGKCYFNNGRVRISGNKIVGEMEKCWV